MALDDGWMTGVLLLPESPFLGHLLVQVPLLAFFSGHSFIVGRESKDGPGPLIWTGRGQSEAPQRVPEAALAAPRLTDELEGQVLVGAGLFGVLVQVHDGPADAAVLQRLLAHAGQLQDQDKQLRSA